MTLEPGRYRLGVDDRIPPVIEVDPLRQELGAEAVPVARDGIDAKGLQVRLVGTGRTRAPVRVQRRCALCASSSAAKTSRALATNRTAPSGWWQAPRAADLSAPAPDARSLVLAFESCGALEGAGDRREPVHTRAALTGALAGEEARDVCGFDEPA